MTSDAAPGSADAGLGHDGEAEWARLRRQLLFADGFWLGFVFSSSPAAVTTLRRRTEHLLALRPARLIELLPRHPEELGQVAAQLFEPETAVAGCTWVQAVVDDRPWRDTWSDLFRLLNERRDAVRRHLAGGLVLAGPLAAKRQAREAAPDLWSIRALVIELTGVAQPLEGMRSDDTTAAEVARPASLTVTGPVARELRSRLDDVSAALAVGRTDVAVEAGRTAVDLVRAAGDDADLVAALTALSRAEEAHGDAAAASDHARQALRRCQESREGHDPVRAELLDRVGRLAVDRADVDTARAAFEELAAIRRRSAAGGPPDALRDLSVALDWLGRVRHMAGDLEGATAAYGEGVAIGRQILQQRDSPEALRALSQSLRRVGDLRRDAGDTAAAAAAYEEALECDRRRIDRFGEIPEQLQDLAVSLGRVGHLRRSMGDMTGAAEAYGESLALARQLVERYGETPQGLRNLSLTLERLGDIRLDSGDVTGAVEAYEESLAIAERALELYGDTPGRTEDVAIARARLGDAQGTEGTSPRLA